MKLNENFGVIPWSVVEQVVKLRLHPASRWQVFLLVLVKSCRHEYGPARLSVEKIATGTGLAVRTVKRALADLLAAGLLTRPKRYGELAVPMLAPYTSPPSKSSRPSVGAIPLTDLPITFPG